MNRGEIWLAQVGHKLRPVLVLTRNEVIDVRLMVTVAEITTSLRGISPEIAFDYHAAGLSQRSVINCDGLHTVTKASLSDYVGAVEEVTLQSVCRGVSHALGC